MIITTEAIQLIHYEHDDHGGEMRTTPTTITAPVYDLQTKTNITKECKMKLKEIRLTEHPLKQMLLERGIPL